MGSMLFLNREPYLQTTFTHSSSQFRKGTCAPVSGGRTSPPSKRPLTLRRGFEVQNHSGSGSCQQESQVEQRIRCGFRRVLPHREEHVNQRRAGENQRHHISRQPAI